MFTHLRRRIDSKSGFAFRYRSCGYGPNMQTVPDRWLNGDENAIVDFRYTQSSRLSWFFDHHVTAFASDDQRDRALEKPRTFFDADYGSCTKLIADVGREQYGVDFGRFQDLVAWADKIDSANFNSAEQAIGTRDPVMQLAGVVEQHGNGELLNHLVPQLLEHALDVVTESDWVQQRWRPIAAARQVTRTRIEDALERQGRVAFVDLHQQPLTASGKFIAYALAPDCVYSVALIRMKQHYKISVGYNPWCQQDRTHDIASLCRHYGGGGHPVVGAVSLPLRKLAQARKVAAEIVATLNGPGTS